MEICHERPQLLQLSVRGGDLDVPCEQKIRPWKLWLFQSSKNLIQFLKQSTTLVCAVFTDCFARNNTQYSQI